MVTTGLSIETWAQLGAVVATLILGGVAVWNICEYKKERKMKLIEKKLDEFYFPLIYMLTPKTVPPENPNNMMSRLQEINRVIIEKRYLAEPKTLEELPIKFVALPSSVDRELYFTFTNRDSYEKWKKALEALWEDAQNLVRRYYKLAGIKKYKLPEEPKWAIKPPKGAEIY